jgi:DNA-binding NtrC family response regulator
MAQNDCKGEVMIVEDDETTRHMLVLYLRKMGFSAVTCASGYEAVNKVGSSLSAILLDLGLPDTDGLGLLRTLLAVVPWVPCFIITGRDSSRVAVECIKAGARDYFTKPVDLNLLCGAIGDAAAGMTVSGPAADLSKSSPLLHHPWKSAAAREIHAMALKASASREPLLIVGESGSGRMTLARMIHDTGVNRTGALHVLNAVDSVESELETHLFGRPGGTEDTPVRGLLQKCGSGTLIITGVEKLPRSLQDKLEKVISTGRCRQQGSNVSVQINCRIICITSVDLQEEAANGRFSKKLAIALRNMRMRLPPLRNRIEDLPVYCEKFLTALCVANHTRRPDIAAATMDLLLRHHWPDNLDELRHCIETAFSNCKGAMIIPSDLPKYLWDPGARVENTNQLVLGSARITEIERASLVAALTLCGGNRRLAAQRLGVSLRTIYNMIRRHRLLKSATKSPTDYE